jgi:soluble lytic murein transglycosylase-like protein
MSAVRSMPAGHGALWLAALPVGIVCCALLARSAGAPEPLGPTRYDAAIRSAARRHMPAGWDWRILKAMVYRESGFDAGVVSSAGAVGLCQLLPATAMALGVNADGLRRPEANLDAGARYLRQCWDAMDGLDDLAPRWERSRAAVAAYHGGPAMLRRARAECGPAGRSWWAISGRLPAPVREHVEAVFDQAYRRVRHVHPGGGAGISSLAVANADGTS